MWREGVEKSSDTPPCCLDGSFGGFSQQGFEFGEDLLDRIEVGAIGRQEQQPRACRTNGLAHSLALVAAKIVHDDDIARLERRDQELLDIGQEASAVDRTIEHRRRVDPVVPKRREEGQCFPVAVRHLGPQPLAAPAAAMGAGHIRLGPSFIDEDEAPGIEPALIPLPARPSAGNVTAILLAGQHAFF